MSRPVEAACCGWSGTAAFGGWAIDDNAAISSVSIYVDGVLAGLATYGSVRADVCTAFPGRSGCPDVGWNFLLDTTKYANGTHILDVTAFPADGERETLSASFNISN